MASAGKRDILWALPSRFLETSQRPFSDLSFLANVHSAKVLAKQEGISAIFACK
jgi:hypothetical protein